MKTIKFKLNSETKIPKQWRDSIPQSGAADQAVAELRQLYDIDVSTVDAQKYLKSTGGWAMDELQDHSSNIDRLIWIATLNCKEENTPWFYMGE